MNDNTLADFIAVWRAASLDVASRDRDELALRRLMDRNELELRTIADPTERLLVFVAQECGLQAELQSRVAKKNDFELRAEVKRFERRLEELEQAIIRQGVKSDLREGRPIEVIRH